WARIALFHFINSAIGREDKGMKERFRQPAFLAGVLRWLVEGAREWYERGVAIPDSLNAAKSAIRSGQDPGSLWLAEEVEQDDEAVEAAALLYRAYSEWCRDNGHKPLNSTNFGRRLTRAGFVSGKGAKGMRCWRGLRVPLGPDSAGRAEQ